MKGPLKAALTVRPATLQDSDRLMSWRNDPDSVRFSLSKRAVTKTEHEQWYNQVLQGHTVQIFICENEGIPVGMYRFTFNPEQAECELAWIVAPDHRGKGYGSQIVQAAVSSAKAKRVFARVQNINPASLAAAKKAGLFVVSESDGVVLFEKP